MDWLELVKLMVVLLTAAGSFWVQLGKSKTDADRDVQVARIGGETKDAIIASLEAKLQNRDEQLVELSKLNAVLQHQLKSTSGVDADVLPNDPPD